MPIIAFNGDFVQETLQGRLQANRGPGITPTKLILGPEKKKELLVLGSAKKRTAGSGP
jgi:hypothetical protein